MCVVRCEAATLVATLEEKKVPPSEAVDVIGMDPEEIIAEPVVSTEDAELVLFGEGEPKTGEGQVKPVIVPF